MSATIKNFVPRDTRMFEIFQGLCQFLVGVIFLYEADVNNLQNYVGMWGAICIIIPIIQFIAILFHPGQLLARVATLWGAGSIWVYLGFNHAYTGKEALIMVVFGLSCFFSFIINTIIISEFDRKDRPNPWIS